MASTEPLVARKRHAPGFLSLQIDSLLCSDLSLLCVGLVAYASIQALRNAHQDPWTAVFAVAAGIVLFLLWLSIREFEKPVSEPSPGSRRRRLKIVILLLSVTINFLFSLRVSMIMNSLLFSCFTYGIASATTLCGVYLLFGGGSNSTPSLLCAQS